jgi:hypothetical protein
MGGIYRTLDATPFLANLGVDAAELGLRAARTVTLPNGQTVVDRITLAASGPSVWSTSTALVPLRSLPIWDVNYYYRELGIKAPYRNVSKKQLRDGYTARNGQSSERLTYCFKQLLDPQIRAKYDRMPLGKPMDDKYRWKLIEEAAAEWASRRSAETGEVHEAKEFLEEVGMDPESIAAREAEIEEAMHSFKTYGWPYAYYLWRSRKFDDATLSEWQSMLISACSERDLSCQLSIGYVGASDQTWLIKEHDGNRVVFFNEDAVPDPLVAAEIADSLYPLFAPRTIPTPISGTDDVSHGQETPMTNPVDEDYEDYFLTGGVAAREDGDAAAAARKAARGKTEYLTQLMPKPGDSCIIRWVTDDQDLLRTKQHSFVATKPAPADKPANMTWPSTSGAVCRYTLKADKKTRWHSDCYICDHMKKSDGDKYFPSDRVWGLAAVREEILGTQEMVNEGKIRVDQIDTVVGIKDAVIEYDEIDTNGNPTGIKLRKKRIVIVNMAIKNFFGPFTSYYQMYGTLLDRDYKIIRRGEAKQTDYHSGALNQISKPIIGADGQPTGQYEIYDLRNPKYADLYADNDMNLKVLRKLVVRQASDDYYARYFDVTKATTWKREDDDNGATAAPSAVPAQGSATAEPAANTPTASRLAAMRDEVMRDNTPTPAAPMRDLSEPVKPAEPTAVPEATFASPAPQSAPPVASAATSVPAPAGTFADFSMD